MWDWSKDGMVWLYPFAEKEKNLLEQISWNKNITMIHSCVKYSLSYDHSMERFTKRKDDKIDNKKHLLTKYYNHYIPFIT